MKIDPNGEKPFIELTPRKALLAALNRADEFDMAYVILGKHMEDGGVDFYVSGAGRTVEIAGMMMLAQHNLLED